MSTMILYEANERSFKSLGNGALIDAIDPLVTQERNGIYELSFEYPLSGELYQALEINKKVVADASARHKGQAFTIVNITRPMNGIVTVYCEHVSYITAKTVLKIGERLENVTAQQALIAWQSALVPQRSDMTFVSDIDTKGTFDLSQAGKFSNAREALGGKSGSLLDTFGGEYTFDNYNIKLSRQAGQETNIVIAYGKNLTDISQEESIENTFTSVYPYATVNDEQGDRVITLTELYVDSEYVGNYPERLIQMVDCSDDEPKTQADLKNSALKYIRENKVGVPKVALKMSFSDLASTVEEEAIQALEVLDVCDTVTVVFNQLGVLTTAKIIKTVWNVTLEQYESVEIGDARTNLSKSFEHQNDQQDKISDHLSDLEKAQNEASDILKNPPEGHVVIYPSLSDPQEILILDTKDINTAQKVWRWNSGGLGFSSTGYNGTYGLAMTNNGSIVADRVTTGVLRAIEIIGVTISGSTITTDSEYSRVRLEGGKIIFTKPGDSTPYKPIVLETGNTPTLNNLKITAPGNTSIDEGTLDISSSGIRMETLSQSQSYYSRMGVSKGESGVTTGGTLRMMNYGRTNTYKYGFRVDEAILTSYGTYTHNGNLKITEGLGVTGKTNIAGDLQVTGSKNAIHVTRDGVRATPAYELAESYLGDIGEANTGETCEIKIPIEALFSDTVNTQETYHVFLSSYSRGHVWVSQ
ncbi:phage tail spike protein [Lactococcus formosensis]|uniref:phage tail spike protein n=1 Tax=Lactococcus formosensis TaxID=1281486 RepID=UPI0039F73596